MIKYLVFLLSISAFSCSKIPEPPIYKTISIDVKSKEKGYDITPLLDTSKTMLIPLQISDKCLLSDDMLKIHVQRDTLYVFDKKSQGLFLFDTTGRMINKIQSVGDGPDDYLDARDIAVTDNAVFIMDYRGRKILKYDTKGQYIGRFSTREWTTDNIIASDGTITYINDWSIIKDTTYKMYTTNYSGENLQGFIPIIKDSLPKFIVRQNFRHATINGKTHIIVPFDQYIYTITPTGFAKTYQVDFGDAWLPEKYRSMSLQQLLHMGTLNQYVYNLSDIFETQSKIFIRYTYGINPPGHIAVYDKQTGQTTQSTHFEIPAYGRHRTKDHTR